MATLDAVFAVCLPAAEQTTLRDRYAIGRSHQALTIKHHRLHHLAGILQAPAWAPHRSEFAKGLRIITDTCQLAAGVHRISNITSGSSSMILPGTALPAGGLFFSHFHAAGSLNRTTTT